MLRKTAQAGYFYPGSAEQCREMLRECLDHDDLENLASIKAGIVPHAGWRFSGRTAGKVYHAIAQKGQPETFVIFGAVHVHGVERAAIWRKGEWETPLGRIAVDESLANLIMANDGIIKDDPQVHLSEHSIEVQIPFLQYLFPKSKIVPIMILPDYQAHKIGEKIAQIVGGNVVVIASTDLTHYGPRFGFAPKGTGKDALIWAKEKNDGRMIELMIDIRAEQVVAEAQQSHNSCGHGAIAAALGYVRAIGGKSGVLLDHTTSWEVYPERAADTSVGYAGVIY